MATRGETVTDDDLTRRVLDTHYCTTDGRCFECGQPHPCDARQLVELVGSTGDNIDFAREEGEADGFDTGWREGYDQGYEEALRECAPDEAEPAGEPGPEAA